MARPAVMVFWEAAQQDMQLSWKQLKRTQRKDDKELTLYPGNHLTAASFDPAADIDVTKREVLFVEKFLAVIRFLYT